MKLLIQTLTLVYALSTNALGLNLKSGDLILQSNPCYLCNLIEAEEHSPYSHMGVLVFENGTWSVLESWGIVKMTPLNEFLSRRKTDSRSLVLRASYPSNKLRLNPKNLMNRFNLQFKGLSYDSDFLWNNSDQYGEKLYCSEFIAKFLQPFLIRLIPTKPMHYFVNREYWIQYFHGNPPDGAPGISPGDFEHSPNFHSVGFL